MAKAKAPPPPHVQAAILAGDTQAILAFASAGGRIAARNARIRKTALARQRVQSEANFNALADDAIEMEQRQTLLHDARVHAMRNLAGTSHD